MNAFDYAKQVCSCESPFVDVLVVNLFIGALLKHSILGGQSNIGRVSLVEVD
jgi:hypothetical protein